MTVKTETLIVCDFCDKNQYQVEFIVMSDNTDYHIRDECIDMCKKYIEKLRKEKNKENFSIL